MRHRCRSSRGRIGVGERHLRRLFAEELGASPLDVAATRRLLFAKKLLTETALPITAIAPAAGFASLRRFNAAFLATYGKPPREIRRGHESTATRDELVLRLPFRRPYDFAHLSRIPRAARDSRRRNRRRERLSAQFRRRGQARVGSRFRRSRTIPRWRCACITPSRAR